jgi:hypothetical protein
VLVLRVLLLFLLVLSAPAAFIVPPLAIAALLHAGAVLAGQYFTLMALRDVVLGVLPAPRGALAGALRGAVATAAVIVAAPPIARAIGDPALAQPARLVAVVVALGALRDALRAQGRDPADVAPSLPIAAAILLPSLAMIAGALMWPTLDGLIALQAVAAALVALAAVVVRAGRAAAPPPARGEALSRAIFAAGLLVLAAFHGPLAVAVVQAANAVTLVASAAAMTAVAKLHGTRAAPLAIALGLAVAALLAWFVGPPLFPAQAGDVRLLLLVQPAVLALFGALWGDRPLPRWRDGVNVAALALAIPAAIVAGAAGLITAGALRLLARKPEERRPAA